MLWIKFFKINLMRSKIKSFKSKYQSSLQELENLYVSLSQRAFRGDLDVSGIPVTVSEAELKPEGMRGGKKKIKPDHMCEVSEVYKYRMTTFS